MNGSVDQLCLCPFCTRVAQRELTGSHGTQEALGSRFVAYMAFDSAEDAEKAAKAIRAAAAKAPRGKSPRLTPPYSPTEDA